MNDEQREASKPSNRQTGLLYEAVVAVSSCLLASIAVLALPDAGPWLITLVTVTAVTNVLALFVAQKRILVKRKPAAAKEFALSLTCLRHLKRQHSITKSVLLGCAFAFGVISFRFRDLGLLNLAAISIAFLGLISLKELLIAYRIRKGLFGTNRTEARDLINFIVKNSSDIDFTDSNGKLRRVLLPEESNARDAAPGKAHGGVTG